VIIVGDWFGKLTNPMPGRQARCPVAEPVEATRRQNDRKPLSGNDAGMRLIAVRFS